MMRSQSASVASRNGVPALTPAQLTRMSARPVSRSVVARRLSIDSRSVTFDRAETGLAAELFEGLDARLAALFGQIGHDDVRPGPDQSGTKRPAKHSGAADHDGRLAREPEHFLQIIS